MPSNLSPQAKVTAFGKEFKTWSALRAALQEFKIKAGGRTCIAQKL